jgi:predicted DNA-binding protein (MmcQ/YjbR family)
MFASMGGEDGEQSCTFKTEVEERRALDAVGEPWFVPAYVGRYGWRGLHLRHPKAAKVAADELTELLTTSWRLTAPKRLVKAFDET